MTRRKGYCSFVLRRWRTTTALSVSPSVDGALCPFVGRISMDLIVVDVTDAPIVERGDSVELLGAEIGLDDFAARAGMIGYEVLTRLGPRSHRRLVGGTAKIPRARLLVIFF